MHVRFAGLAVVISAAGLAGCSWSTDAAVRKRAADKEVNTRHLKGTTDVLRSYRFAEAPTKKPGGNKTPDKKTPEEKPK